MAPTRATRDRTTEARVADPRAADGLVAAARPSERGPMAHRATRSASASGSADRVRPSAPAPAGSPKPGAAAVAPALATAGGPAGARRLAPSLAGALGAEVGDLVGISRRVVPSRRAALLIGLALLALLALGGIAGAAEPKPAARSALEAFASSAAPAATSAPGGAAALAPASAAPATLTLPASSAAATARAATTGAPTALADDLAFKGPDLLDLGAKTALVVALLFVTLRVMRRVQGAGPARGAGLLAVLESRSLGPKTQLHLVAVGDRRLVIGQSPAGLVALGELDAAELPVAEPVREPWARRDAQDEAPELEAQAVHELATGRRTRLGVSA